MPSGIPFNREIRELIEFHHRNGLSPNTIHELIFMSDSSKCSLKYIRILCGDLNENHFASNYVSGPHPQRTTREWSRRLDWRAVDRLMEMRTTDREINFRSLTLKFNEYLFGTQIEDYVSVTLCRRIVLDRMRWSRKVLERRHRDANPLAQLSYMEDLASRNVSSLKDIDEMNISPTDFNLRFGYAPVGDSAVKQQIVIGSRSFSAIAMIGIHGVEAYDFFEAETIDGIIFSEFIVNKCFPVILSGEIGILDNASIHRTDAARDAMELAFDGDWTYCAPYSPQLKPIERVFALIKGYLRANETDALLDPTFWIN